MKSSRDRVTDLFEGPSARNELRLSLLEAFVASRSNTDKGFLAQWIRDAGAGGSLGHVGDLDPTETDVEILLKVFPDSKRLSDLVRRRDV